MSDIAKQKAEMTEAFQDAISRVTDPINGKSPRLTDVLGLAQTMMSSMEGFYDALDAQMYDEFRTISEHITTMRDDISGLEPTEIKNNKMPLAGRELDAIVKSTEEATNTIMGAAEVIMAADTSDPAAYQTAVNDEVMKIFEACSFQDITGQRISKVVETLQFIERRVDRLVGTMGLMEGEVKLTEEEQAAEDRKKDQILNGPQMEGEGQSQDDIDALFD